MVIGHSNIIQSIYQTVHVNDFRFSEVNKKHKTTTRRIFVVHYVARRFTCLISSVSSSIDNGPDFRYESILIEMRYK